MTPNLGEREQIVEKYMAKVKPESGLHDDVLRDALEHMECDSGILQTLRREQRQAQVSAMADEIIAERESLTECLSVPFDMASLALGCLCCRLGVCPNFKS